MGWWNYPRPTRWSESPQPGSPIVPSQAGICGAAWTARPSYKRSPAFEAFALFVIGQGALLISHGALGFGACAIYLRVARKKKRCLVEVGNRFSEAAQSPIRCAALEKVIYIRGKLHGLIQIG